MQKSACFERTKPICKTPQKYSFIEYSDSKKTVQPSARECPPVVEELVPAAHGVLGPVEPLPAFRELGVFAGVAGGARIGRCLPRMLLR